MPGVCSCGNISVASLKHQAAIVLKLKAGIGKIAKDNQDAASFNWRFSPGILETVKSGLIGKIFNGS